MEKTWKEKETIQKAGTVPSTLDVPRNGDFTMPRFLHHVLFKSWQCFRTVRSSIIPGLEQVAKVLDNVSWKYWKPGEQPAKILDWMQLRLHRWNLWERLNRL